MHILATPILESDFSAFGIVHAMAPADPARADSERLIRAQGPGWTDVYTKAPLLAANASLGLTLGSASPFVTTRMERHPLTEEALFCAADPIVLAVAAPTSESQPQAADVRAFVIAPGTVVVLHKGTWHDACHGLARASYYYWMATTGLAAGSPWRDVEGGPVHVGVGTGTEA